MRQRGHAVALEEEGADGRADAVEQEPLEPELHRLVLAPRRVEQRQGLRRKRRECIRVDYHGGACDGLVELLKRCCLLFLATERARLPLGLRCECRLEKPDGRRGDAKRRACECRRCEHMQYRIH